MTVGQIVRKLYFKQWIRIPMKFVICFAFLKIGYDYYEYKTAWRVRGPCPRSQLFHDMSPTEPPLYLPYPYYETYEEFKHLKQFYKVSNAERKLNKLVAQQYFVHFDSPYRENVNAVDRFLLRGREHSTSEKTKFYMLNEMAKKEGNVPQGVYQEIRKVREHQLDAQKTLVPQL